MVIVMSMKTEIYGQKIKTYSFSEMVAILKGAGVKPNSFKEVKVLIHLTPNGWIYAVTGFSESSRMMQAIVKGFETEAGSVYIDELLSYPLQILVLEKTIPFAEAIEKLKLW